MVGVAARSGWVVGAGLVLALACGGKADSDVVFDEAAAGGEAGEETTGGRASTTGGILNAPGGSATGGVAAGGAVSDESGGEGGVGGQPAPARCGNAIVELPEICDDGEDNGPYPARCTTECTLIECGNGELDPGEECDDGEANSTVASCLPNCVRNICGDGYAYLEETPGANSPESLHPCDDANGYFSDACTDDCQWAVCGDGKVYLRGYGEEYDSSEDGNPSEDNAAAVEECDDGNDLSGDGCDAECVVEINF